ncbi:MAG: hypothetical protein IBX45_10925 [Campylobacterales bacterium]|nr:hypothetical protein [Campylobacterales bacterium]
MSQATHEFNSIFNAQNNTVQQESTTSAADSIHTLQEQAGSFIAALDWALWGGLLAFFVVLYILFRIVSANKYAVAYTLRKMRYALPFFSPLGKYAKDLSARKEGKAELPYGLWMLFSDFATFYRTFDKNEKDYDNWRAYLRKAGELGRKPMPWYIGIMILTLVLFEAILVAYILQSYVMPGGSKADYDFWAVVVGLIIAVVMMVLTHKTGGEMYYNTMVDKLRGIAKPEEVLERNTKVDWENNKDDDASPALQMFNRTHPNINERGVPQKKHLVTILTISLIVGMSIAAYVVRATTFLDELESKEDTSLVEMFNRSGGSEPGKGAMSFDQLIQENRDDAVQSGKQTRETAMDIMKEKNLILANETTFMVLSGMFFAIQFLSILFGRTYGFAGAESERVYHALRGFDNREKFAHYMEMKKRTIFSGVRDLQKQWYKKASRVAFGEEEQLLEASKHMSFLDYIQHEKEAS